MRWLDAARARFALLVARETAERRMDAEIAFHIEMETERLMHQEGLERGDASRRAHVAFGGVEKHKEALRDGRSVRWLVWLSQLSFDLRVAVRSLRRSPGLVTVIVLTLSLGIGATSALFAVVDRLFFKPPAGVANAEALRRLYVMSTQTPDRLPQLRAEFSYSDFLTLRDALSPGAELTAFTAPDTVRVGSEEGASMLRASYVAGNYFQLLGVNAGVGRFFGANDDQMSAPSFVAVLSEGAWRRMFAGRADIIGQRLKVDEREYTVVGIAQSPFGGIDLSTADVWLPMSVYPRAPAAGRPWYQASMPVWFGSPLELVARRTGDVTDVQLASIATTVLRRPLPDGQVNRWRPDSTASVTMGPINQARGPTISGATTITQPHLLQMDSSLPISTRLMELSSSSC
jgi:hypothetical protein